MSSFRLVSGFLLVLGALCFNACKIRNVAFTRDQLDGQFVNDAFRVLYPSEESYLRDGVDTAHAQRFEARLQEILINKDNVGQTKIVPLPTKENTILDIQGNKHILYLYCYPARIGPKCMLLSSMFNEDDECVSLGPAYLGMMDDNTIQFSRKVAINRKEDRFYLNRKRTEKVDIRFVSSTLSGGEDGIADDSVLFDRIVSVRNENPKEYLVFELNRIFQENKGLLFTKSP